MKHRRPGGPILKQSIGPAGSSSAANTFANLKMPASISTILNTGCHLFLVKFMGQVSRLQHFNEAAKAEAGLQQIS
jgi:hypothetical protein